MRGIAVAYEVHVALVGTGNGTGISLHKHKVDHMTHIAAASAAGMGAMLDLPVETIYHAINFAVHNAISSRQSRKGDIGAQKEFVPGFSAEISIEAVHNAMHGLKGPNHAVVTACSSGAHAIGDAARMVALDDADIMVAGGAEAAISRIGMAGFAACRALSTGFNEEPHRGSRPYDKDRDGFVMGEGAGMVILEELEHARRRGAKIYAEVKGYGMSGDAHHITAPAEDGNGGFRSMQMALKRAGMMPSDIDYVNAHGTSTPLGDEIELRAVERLFGNAAERVSMSSTKSSIGHLLGAAGAVEAIFSILALRDQICPPTLNLDNPSVETKIDLVPHQAKKREIRAALSNSFGFGGTNATLILTRAS